jgi:hypothetical protein
VPARPIDAVPTLKSHSFVDVSSDLEPAIVTHVEELAPIEALTPGSVGYRLRGSLPPRHDREEHVIVHRRN